MLTLLTLINGRRQTFRDGMFKCFDAYLRVMEYRSKAEEYDRSNPKDEAGSRQRWWDYYRALFDLQWTEYYLWKHRGLRDEPYRQWLTQRQHQFKDGGDETVPTKMTYAKVWSQLKEEEYYANNDPFVSHLDTVHAAGPEKAMEEDRPWQNSL